MYLLTNGKKKIKFNSVYDAAAYAIEHHYSNFKGWKIYNDSTHTEYSDEDWGNLASYLN